MLLTPDGFDLLTQEANYLYKYVINCVQYCSSCDDGLILCEIIDGLVYDVNGEQIIIEADQTDAEEIFKLVQYTASFALQNKLSYWDNNVSS